MRRHPAVTEAQAPTLPQMRGRRSALPKLSRLKPALPGGANQGLAGAGREGPTSERRSGLAFGLRRPAEHSNRMFVTSRVEGSTLGQCGWSEGLLQCEFCQLPLPLTPQFTS